MADDGGLTWARLDGSGAAAGPGARSGHTAVVLGSSVYVFGGLDPRSSPPAPNAELWAADLQQPRAELSWSRVHPVGAAAPAARWRHSATPISKGRMLLFGGQHGGGGGGARLKDTWIFDAAARGWSQVFVPGVSANQGNTAVNGAGAGGGAPRGGLGHRLGAGGAGGKPTAAAAASMALLGGGSVTGGSKLAAAAGGGRLPSMVAGGRLASMSVGGGGAAGGGTSFGAAFPSFITNALALSSGGGADGAGFGLASFGASFGGAPASSSASSSDDVLADVGQPVEEVTTTTAGGGGAQSHAAPLPGEDAPAPRAGHTAVCIGDNVWLFGGFGGAGHARRDFGDVHRFHVPTQTWTAVKTAGDLSQPAPDDGDNGDGNSGADVAALAAPPSHPEPRSGHSAVAVGDVMLIHGGWSAARAFADTWALDTVTLTWKRVDAACALPRWGAAAVAVPAVPHTQVFLFGGTTQQAAAVAAPGGGKASLLAAAAGRTGGAASAFATLAPATAEPAKPSPATTTGSVGLAGVVGGTAFVGETLVLEVGSGGGWAALPTRGAPAPAAGAAPTSSSTTTTSRAGASKATAAAAAAAASYAASTPASPAAAASTRPQARADAALMYDPFGKRLLVLGGWANGWLGDVWALPVGGLIGPPYAVLGLQPACGPITGSQPLTVVGKGFGEPGGSAVVRFSLGKRAVEAVGACTSDTTIDVVTPVFEGATGAGSVDVRVALKGAGSGSGGGAWSITSRPYAVFHVTSAAASHAYGPGLLDGVLARAPVTFLVQARDTAGGARTAGGDEFVATVTHLGDGSSSSSTAGGKGAAAHVTSGPVVGGKGAAASAAGTPVPCELTDCGYGRYAVTYTPPAPGRYAVAVAFNGTFGGPAGPVRGSPFSLIVKDGGSAGSGGAGAQDPNSWGGPVVWEGLKALVDAASATAKATLEGITRDVTAAAATAAAGADHTAGGAAAHTSAASAPPPLDLVLSVKSHLRDVAGREGEVRLALDCAGGLLEALRREGGGGGGGHRTTERELAAVEARLAKAAATWEAAGRAAPTARAALAPHVKHWSTATRKDVEALEAATAEFVAHADEGAYWLYATGHDAAVAALAAHRERFASFMRRVERQAHVATTLDLPHALDGVHASVAAVAEETADLERLWALVADAGAYFTAARDTLWSSLVPEELEEGVKALHKRLKASCATKRVRGCDAFKGADKAVRDFASTLPLLGALRHKSMRPRHWAGLMGKIAAATAAAGAAATTHGGGAGGKSHAHRPASASSTASATSSSPQSPPHAAAPQLPFTCPSDDPSLRLGALLDLRLHDHAADVEETADQALKEAKMEETLARLAASWGAVAWHGEPFKEGGTVMQLKMTEDDWEMTEGDQLTVQGMMSSRYLAHFEAEVTAWQRALAAVSEVVTQLAEIQRKWAYLEALFIGSDEVRRELPDDAARFEGIDVAVRAILAEAWATRSVKDACAKPGLLAALEGLTAGLDACEKALTDFLDAKRRAFPRFYFMSKADLLDVLSNGSTPARILPHVPKVLLATDSLQLQPSTAPGGRPVAVSWSSCVGVEAVAFNPPVPLEGKVEVYMQTVLDGQRGALRRALHASLARRAVQGRVDWIMDKSGSGSSGAATDPAQITLLVSGMDYVASVEAAFDALAGSMGTPGKGGKPAVAPDRGAMQAALDRSVSDLSDLIRLTQSSSLSRGDRTRVMCLITLDAHGRDIIQKLIAEGVTDKAAFQWQSQLKQRYAGDGRAVLSIADARFDYQFEYLGNGPRLVVTPLTDRIYVTATQALNLRMGCAPAGPAGTGKTETTKDLAAALALPCYVVNCAPEMDYMSLAGIFKGLAASGSWGCFDEFNRLVPEVLSVCATQFGAMLESIRAGRPDVTIEGDTVRCVPTAGAFITMNPGYLGRSELPEGLKSLFRPITVMIPDLVLICENMLMAEGFVQAKVLASKFYSLYQLCRELLSKCPWYDWGLRAIKSVLVVAGSFKRAEPHLPEEVLLMRALRDFNTPKLPTADEGPFFGLLGDLFPGVDPPRKQDATLEEAVVAACGKGGLDADAAFRLKVVQLEELLAIRHCVFVMGPPGSGKTTAWRTLAAARGELRRRTKVVDLDPKVQSPEELYGFIHPATREWRDGLLSRVMRDLANEPGDDAKWIVLDGDLDANWIESMNSVMDDNKLLTLASNERIPLKPHMRLLFEIRDLRFASPATVSRAGIIYISTQSGSQWRSLVKTWVARLGAAIGGSGGSDGSSSESAGAKLHARLHAPPLGASSTSSSSSGGGSAAADDAAAAVASLSSSSSTESPLAGVLRGLFDRYVGPALLFLKKECKPIVPVEDVTHVTNLLRLLDATLTPELLGRLGDAGRTPPDEAARALETHFVFAALWAFGGALAAVDGEDYRAKFSAWWRGEFTGVRLPSRDTVFDYWLNPATLQFDSWKAAPLFREVAFDSRTMAMAAVTVPTPETVAISHWAELLLRGRAPVMLAGYAGCGKTQLVNGLLAASSGEQRASATVNFNFFTDSKALQATLEAPLEKKTGSNYGPRGAGGGGGGLVFFLDDLNLPEVDRYDTQSAIALVRQHLDYGHWYDRAKLTPKTILGCQYVAAMNPTAGSFAVNPRLQRHFTTLAVGFPGPGSLHTIFSTFLEGHLHSRGFAEEVQAGGQALLAGALALHAAVSAAFRKSATNFHYEFSVRHLAAVFGGLLQAGPGEFREPGKLAALWLHESERVYGDRLASVEDVARYRALAAGVAKKKFAGAVGASLASFFGDRPDALLFSHFSGDGGGAGGSRVYDRVPTTDKLRHVVEESLREYNESLPAMNLVLFDAALEHVARIARVLLQPQGHALLVGVGGSGKQSLARLAAFMCGYRVVSITITGGYGLGDLLEDVKRMYTLAGVKEEGVVFLFTDAQVTHERFLVVLNDILASGSVPGLFAADEEDAIMAAMVPKVKAATGVAAPDRATCWAHFLATVRANLHVVLCFSPVGDDFRARAKRFPALTNNTVIDWFHPWPREALHSVAAQFMRGVDLGPLGLPNPDAVREGIVAFMPFAFDTVNRAAARFRASDRRAVYTTPKSFLECLHTYKALLGRRHAASEAARARLASGLAKLRDTAAAVSKIEEELKACLAAAEEKRVVAEGIAAEVLASKTVVEGETAKAAVLADECAAIAGRATEIREDAERDLAAAIPAVEKAMEALNTLDKKDLAEAKTMAKPPPGVDDVFAAVMVLLAGVRKEVKVEKTGKVKDRGWDASKKALLTDVKGFIDQLMAFKEAVDANEVPDTNFKEVRPYLQLEHFTPEGIRSKNSAAAGLCSWAINIVGYYDIVVTVAPKKEKLRAATEELEGANARLGAVRAQVATLQAQLDELGVKLAAAEGEKAAAVAEVDHSRGKLELATRLTAALADENVRWAAAIADMAATKDAVVGDSLLAAAFISYIGPFTKRYRDELVARHWVPFLETAVPGGGRLPMSPAPNPLAVLADDATIAGWKAQGLPDDTVSVENGAICTQTERWPLLIDPQLQGIAWLRERERESGLLVLRVDQKDMLRRLEGAIEGGTPVLIENLPERIDAVLAPVIARQLVRRGHKKYLKLGDREVEWHPRFRLYLHTKLSNPHYPPEVQAEAALVNFTVTEAGLEEQLLALTVGRERPDLSSQKTALMAQSHAFRVQIQALEDGILRKLADATGDIAEDRELIEGLENTKRIAQDIVEKSAIVAKTTAEINRTSEKYRSVAHRAALLFFLMMDLGRLHSYYSYSLAAFVTVFNRAIDSVSGERDPARLAAAAAAAEVAALEDGAVAPGADDADGVVPAVAEAAATAAGVDTGASAPAPTGETAATSPASAPVRVLTDEQLVARCALLRETATAVTFAFVQRGLFEKDRLTVAAHLACKLLVDAGELPELLVRALVVGPPPSPGGADPGPLPPALAEWMPEGVWARARALEGVRPAFERLTEDVAAASPAWRAWFDAEKPEALPLPGEYAGLGTVSIHGLLLLRALRPDRLSAGLRAFIAARLGDAYVGGPPFSMGATYAESTASTPIFFVLFPGVDPTTWVEELGRARGITPESGRLVNISMGQGQEARAVRALTQLAATGGWVLLQNVHLMTTWLPSLERQLELLQESAHPDFRVFISAEPPPLAHMRNVPESLLQSCIKVANEAPADLLSNLSRAWACFTEERIAACAQPSVLKACLFALCFYHALVLGRRRFGQQGWSRKYSFNNGDLLVCANVLCDYINAHPGRVPWDDLRYIFGEIMYGGHITDAWDRRTNGAYLAELLRPEVCVERTAPLAPGFFVPDTAALDHAGIAAYISARLPREAPGMFGLHANAEIGYLTSTGDELLRAVLAMSPLLATAATAAPAAGAASSSSSSASSSSSSSKDAGVRAILDSLLERLPPQFSLLELEARAAPLLGGPSSPFVLVCLQECESMNGLLAEIGRSLGELRKGLDGSLNMSEPMEDLAAALAINQVPGRDPFAKCSWERLAWPSRRGLASWFADLLRRCEQLAAWSAAFVTPPSVWLPGLFNPMAFITAVVQRAARSTGLPLDKMAVTVHVTTLTRPEQAAAAVAAAAAAASGTGKGGGGGGGMFVHGLLMEGAGWPAPPGAAAAGSLVAAAAGGDDDAPPAAPPAVGPDGVPVAGHVTDARLKQLLQPLPLLYLTAEPVQPGWLPSSVGYLRRDPAVYEAPVYATTARGPTYVFLATLAAAHPVAKWVLAGAALIMQEDD